MMLLEIVFGFVAGVITGLFGWLFRFTLAWSSNFLLKTIYIILVAIILTVASELSGFLSAKYVAALTCGYICQLLWKGNKPSDELEKVWFVLKHFLFSCVGANLNLNKIKIGNIPYEIAIIFSGLSMRFLTTFLITFSQGYSKKERLFMAICWIPKATVQAALSGLFVMEAKKKELYRFVEFGEFI